MMHVHAPITNMGAALLNPLSSSTLWSRDRARKKYGMPRHKRDMVKSKRTRGKARR